MSIIIFFFFTFWKSLTNLLITNKCSEVKIILSPPHSNNYLLFPPSTTFTNTEINNCFTIHHTGTKKNQFIYVIYQIVDTLFCLFGGQEVNSTLQSLPNQPISACFSPLWYILTKKFFVLVVALLKNIRINQNVTLGLCSIFFCGNAANKKETSHVVVIQENTNNPLINSLYFLTNLVVVVDMISKYMAFKFITRIHLFVEECWHLSKTPLFTRTR